MPVRGMGRVDREIGVRDGGPRREVAFGGHALPPAVSATRSAARDRAARSRPASTCCGRRERDVDRRRDAPVGVGARGMS
ncbi:hypothetical protein SAMN02745121_00009 [Nannocystis exedens]|uniref:Uncharacterized protein n=1 Tax=Nannocystis exedens TaxID=54 RepID=A0A1I1SFX4_9BACT|nr:hypothetical protein NAEX_08580 [Nannocystis exedens]SFD45385.1 hypothetical protein SAMN02745121_00009 [Nannocystis exedens]